MAAELATLKKRLSTPKWCPQFLQGKCEKTDCKLPHHSAATVEEIKRSSKAFGKASSNSVAAPAEKKKKKPRKAKKQA